MDSPRITLRLCGESRRFSPGGVLSAEYRLHDVPAADIRSLEISVLWYTEGKGDEDLGVHFFERLTAEEAKATPPDRPERFETVLPQSPLSYDGLIVRIHWCARVRLFLSRSRQIMAEQPFTLGAVPAARLIEPLRPLSAPDAETSAEEATRS